jgi:hypothetical protein
MKPQYHQALLDDSLDHLGRGQEQVRPNSATPRRAPSSDKPEKGPSVRLATLPRKENEELRIELDEYNGFKFVSVRIWFRAGDGQWRPTKTGITIKSRELETAWGALGKAVELLGDGGPRS